MKNSKDVDRTQMYADKRRNGRINVVNYFYENKNNLKNQRQSALICVPFHTDFESDPVGNRTHFHYADEGLIGEYDASGTEIKTYGYQPNSTWTTDPLFMKQGSGYYFYRNDHLGTPMQIEDVDGNIVWSATYDAFGNAQIGIATVENNLRFPGQYYDSETGLHYNWYRYYDPGTGRYLRTDPIGFKREINYYAYSNGNPVNLIDPLGLFSVDFGVGTQFGIVDITYSFFNGLGGSLTTPGLGFGGFVCFNICDEEPDSDCSPYPFDDKPLKPVPLTYSAGAGRRASISFSDDFCNICVNIGPSIGFPLTIGLPLGKD